MTENKRFQIIHLGNPYDFVVKDHQTNNTYGKLQGDDKSLMELLNDLSDENEQLKQSIQEYKAILQDMGILMSDEDVVNIRNDIADKFLKPLFEANGFDVDIDTVEGFTVIPKGDVE